MDGVDGLRPLRIARTIDAPKGKRISRVVDYRDIREFKRVGRYLGETYTVLAWAEGGKFFLSAIDITGYPRVEEKDLPGCDSLDEIMAFGMKRAREYIDEL